MQSRPRSRKRKPDTSGQTLSHLSEGVARVDVLSGALGPGPPCAPQASNRSASVVTGKVGELDCNGDSSVQKSIRAMTCTDIRGLASVDNANTWGGKFYDNGQYIGHDEPDTIRLRLIDSLFGCHYGVSSNAASLADIESRRCHSGHPHP